MTQAFQHATLVLKRAGPHSVWYWVVVDGKRVQEINLHTHREKASGRNVGITVRDLRP